MALKMIGRFLFLGIISILTVNQSYPHVESGYSYRITNRRYVSHILFQSIEKRNYITILMTHPLPHAFHAVSHSLRYSCGEISECLHEMKRLDQFLRTGYNIELELSGSEIIKIRYLEP